MWGFWWPGFHLLGSQRGPWGKAIFGMRVGIGMRSLSKPFDPISFTVYFGMDETFV